MIEHGESTALVDAQCWAYGTPMSAAAYVSLSERSGAVDVYSSRGSAVARLSQLAVRTLVVCGSEDEAVKLTHGTIADWKDDMLNMMPPDSELQIIDGATHSFAGFERDLATIVGGFAARIVQG